MLLSRHSDNADAMAVTATVSAAAAVAFVNVVSPAQAFPDLCRSCDFCLLINVPAFGGPVQAVVLSDCVLVRQTWGGAVRVVRAMCLVLSYLPCVGGLREVGVWVNSTSCHH